MVFTFSYTYGAFLGTARQPALLSRVGVGRVVLPQRAHLVS